MCVILHVGKVEQQNQFKGVKTTTQTEYCFHAFLYLLF